MKFPRRQFLLALFCLLSFPLRVLRAAEPEFIPLFEGEYASQWKLCGRQKIALKNGVVDTASSQSQDEGLLWYAGKKFGDFTLRVEFKRDRAGWGRNSGVYFRIEDPGDDPKNAYATGYNIEINEPGDTGAIVNHNPPRNPAPEMTGRWNEMVLTVIGPRVSLAVNHQVINEYELGMALRGFIGLENWRGGPGVQFRNLLLKELPVSPSFRPEPGTLEEALLCFEWKCHSTFDNKSFTAWFLPDGKMKRTKIDDLVFTWAQGGPRDYKLKWKEKTATISFRDSGFQRFEGTGFDGTAILSGERGAALPPPTRILEKQGKKREPEVFVFTPAPAP